MDTPVKIPEDFIRRVDVLVAQLRQTPSRIEGQKVSRSAVLRAALYRGIRSLEEEYLRGIPDMEEGKMYRIRASRSADHIQWYLSAGLAEQGPIPFDKLTEFINSDGSLLLTGGEAMKLFKWASGIKGWPVIGPKPLHVDIV